ncbi:ABC transporter permease [Olivibacter sp. SDN3]|uniref:ABC transporter permease n=1 Tax=Olivibacter sp. SDN3 TaxID=2764720 RepID=UPI0016514A6E|nr:FtsX-like permease family protein [Olivibacter sp. SDN3]QNL47817.1 ABC transporter permease [Olivibacter sp. SDN3]
MLRHYLLTAFRNLLKNKVFGAINITGLAVGYTVAILIALFICDEFSFDRYHTKADRIFRINSDFLVNGSSFHVAHAPAPLGPALKHNYPKIADAVRIKPEQVVVKTGNELFREEHSFFADANLFRVFDFITLQGNPDRFLHSPGTVVVSKRTALKYFGHTDVAGKTLMLNDSMNYSIEGVIEDLPRQSHVRFDIIRSIADDPELPSRSNIWLNVGYTTYVLANEGVSIGEIDAYLKNLTKSYAEPQLKNFINSSLEDIEVKGGRFGFYAFPLTDIHLYSTIEELEVGSNIKYVYMLGCIGLFILIIACFNYINLSTVQSITRVKEVGVRKVLGSGRRGIILQFLSESALIATITIVLCLILLYVSLPVFNQISGKDIRLFSGTGKWLTPIGLIIATFAGLLASVYPAIFSSVFQPSKALKGRIPFNLKGQKLRNGLMMVQFAAGLMLIIGTITVYKQLNFVLNTPLGYNRNQVIVLHNTAVLGVHALSFKQDILAINGVEKGTMAGFLPAYAGDNTRLFNTQATAAPGQAHALRTWFVDADFIPTLEIPMLKGRNFLPNEINDSSAVVINAKAADILGYKGNGGESVYQMGGEPVKLSVLGVMDNFNDGSLKVSSQPLVLMLSKNSTMMAFKINSRQNMHHIISRMEETYRDAVKEIDVPFNYSFLDEGYQNLYQAEEKLGKLFLYFSCIAIILAASGLVGLLGFIIQRRMKEIGLRKLLGANVYSIYGMLAKTYLYLIGFSMLIAFPAAFFLMNQWLQDFAYRTSLNLWVFVAAGGMMILIMLIIISYQLLRAANAKPVTVLRTDE